MKEEIFTPLGMSQTFPDQIKAYTAADAKMYFFKKGNLKLDNRIVDGSYKLAGAGFRSTSEDLAKMMKAYQNGFISPKVVESMFSNTPLSNGEKTNVGIAWRLSQDMKGHPTIEHAGSWQGARTVIVYYPEQELSVSIMINTKSIIFIEETAQLVAQCFLSKQTATAANLNKEQSVLLTNQGSDGSSKSYDGKLSLSTPKAGRMQVDTEIEWLKDNRLYYINGQDIYALSTPFGLVYLKLNSLPKIQGELYLYQVLSDPYHIKNNPMFSLKEK